MWGAYELWMGWGLLHERAWMLDERRIGFCGWGGKWYEDAARCELKNDEVVMTKEGVTERGRRRSWA